MQMTAELRPRTPAVIPDPKSEFAGFHLRCQARRKGGDMAEDDIITGRCLCGAVRFEVTRPPSLTSCNCSACRRYAALWAYAPPARARIDAAPGATIAYSRGDQGLAFHSCARCGVTTHYASLINERLALNLRLADDPAEIAVIPVRHFDGAATWTYLDET
jgi:hypothetical protein